MAEEKRREKILFLTGSLAEKRLRQVLEEMAPDFDYVVHNLGLKVAALMTADMIRRRLKETFGADKIVVPGHCGGDLEALSRELGIPVIRGPVDLKDLPAFFGKGGKRPDLSRYDIHIFAEITEAPRMSVEEIVTQARWYRDHGADVIDIGFLPGQPFPHFEEVVAALKGEGFVVSADTLEPENIRRAARSGVDFLLSLHEETVPLAAEGDFVPILIPQPPQNLEGLERAVEALERMGRPYLLDPILEPIHFGFTESIVRYHEVRRRYPEAEMMMGVGNLTELTHADTIGINTLLLGICSELRINYILHTQVSDHCRRAVPEADLARRILYYARENHTIPKHIHPGLMPLHEIKPFPYTLEEVKELASQIRDPSFRIVPVREGICIFNRDGFHLATDPFELFPKLGVEQDGGHAFYLGYELCKAKIAWQLGKRYEQDEELKWGVAVDPEEKRSNVHDYKPAGTTLEASRKKRG